MKAAMVILLVASALLASICPLIYSLMNPELTQMQVFLKFWYLPVIGIILFMALMLIGDKK